MTQTWLHEADWTYSRARPKKCKRLGQGNAWNVKRNLPVFWGFFRSKRPMWFPVLQRGVTRCLLHCWLVYLARKIWQEPFSTFEVRPMGFVSSSTDWKLGPILPSWIKISINHTSSVIQQFSESFLHLCPSLYAWLRVTAKNEIGLSYSKFAA